MQRYSLLSMRQVARLGRSPIMTPSSVCDIPICAILREPLTPHAASHATTDYIVALLTLWRVPQYLKLLVAPTRARTAVHTSPSWSTPPTSAKAPEQSPLIEVPLNARVWPRAARHSSHASYPLLHCEFRPSSPPRGLVRSVTVYRLRSS